MPGYGDSTPAGTADSTSDPLLLPGTGITGITTSMTALAMRVHRKSSPASGSPPNEGELWYLDAAGGGWMLLPVQPVFTGAMAPTISRAFREVSTLQFALQDDATGSLAPENRNSPWNYDSAAAWSPLLDEARPVLLRAGAWCWFNAAAGIAPSSTLPPANGTSLSSLTDGTLGDISVSSAGFVQFQPTSAAAFSLTVDLGTVQRLEHAVLRFGSRTTGGWATLPAGAELLVSTDGAAWQPAFATPRPLGGNGFGAGGDWDDDRDGRQVEVAFVDAGLPARYVQFEITPTGAQTIFVDQLAIYTSSQGGSVLGFNQFCGYLGDGVDALNSGLIVVQATDVLKRLADMNSVMVTRAYYRWELADILYDLLTSASYWRGTGAGYNAPFPPSGINWTNGVQFTGYQVPVWQGRRNSVLGYVQELARLIGWQVWADGSGVLQLTAPPWQQHTPDRLWIAAAEEGQNDVRRCERIRAGKDLRNRVALQTSQTKNEALAYSLSDPNSVAEYGERIVVVTDSLATSLSLQKNLCRGILRDYAWRVQTLNATLTTDAQTVIRGVCAFRAAARPNLYPRECDLPGALHLREQWSLTQMQEVISAGTWEAACQFVPYRQAFPEPPQLLSAVPVSGSPGSATLTWSAIADTSVQTLNVYLSTTTPTPPFPRCATGLSALPGSGVVSGLSAGVLTWVYVTAVDDFGSESLPGNVVGFTPGGSSGSASPGGVTNLTAQLIRTDTFGISFAYGFQIQFTAPPAGICRLEPVWYPGAAPSQPTDVNNWYSMPAQSNGQYYAGGAAATLYPRFACDTDYTGMNIAVAVFTTPITAMGLLESNVVAVPIPSIPWP